MIKETYNPHQAPQVGDYVKIDDSTLPRDFTCRVARVVVKESEDSYLVEFVESHPGLHDGHLVGDKAFKGKAHRCWWVGKENMAPLKVDAMIMNDGDTIYCQRSDKRRITGTATCSKLDEYDPMVGAIIAFARAHGTDPTAAAYRVLKVFSKIPEEPAPKKLRLVFSSTGNPFGEVGAPTPYKDKDGVPLYVGDQVQLRAEDWEPRDLNVVAETPEDGPFVMGICHDCNAETGEVKHWELEWKKSWKELKPGDKVHSGYLEVVEAPAAPAPKLEILKGKTPYGIVGTPTKMKDCRGAQLFVGDRVKIRSNYTPYESEYLRLVVEDDQKQFVMGIKGSCNADTGKISDNWRIEKVKGFQTLTTDYVDPDSDFDFKVAEVPAAKKPKKKLVLRWSFGYHKLLGNVGDPTPLIDRDGEKLCIGDQVECFVDGVPLSGIEPIVLYKECGPESNGGYYAMGLGSIDFAAIGDHEGYAIKKVKSYTELTPGELLSDGAVEVKEEEIDVQ